MRVLARVVVLSLSVLAPVTAFAQDGPLSRLQSIGAHFGSEFDNDDGWMVVGLDSRIALGVADLELNPKFTFRPSNDGSSSQIDVNILYNYLLASPGRLHPFVGLGGAVRHNAFDAAEGETAVGLNLVSGARFDMTGGARYQPFLNTQYTIVNNQRNDFTLVVGVAFTVN